MKAKLDNKEHFDLLDIKNWEVEVATPPNDILWHEINKGKSRSWFVRFLLGLLPLICSILFIGALTYAEHELKTQLPDYIIVLVKYTSPLLLIYFAFYALPFLIYKIVQLERHDKKSEKEESFMNKNIFLMILNLLILPFLVSAILTYIESNYEVNEHIPVTPKFPKN